MSQEDIYNIIKELGGKATIEEIRKRAQKKYPTRTLHLYVLNRLKKLEVNKQVKKEGEKWKIKKR